MGVGGLFIDRERDKMSGHVSFVGTGFFFSSMKKETKCHKHIWGDKAV